ncbi:probable protein phosphatase 2C 26 isoform X2 [Vitis vinifera]|nr:probable protein phosphatase 2C 26 isoform X2 [Vitis vinifera]|eukprot:XP_002273518.2 PREDICTED: probable protein phosphatase 2C 26 [Vitis vinifera]
MNAPAGNRTRVCTVAGYYSTTRPLVLVASFTELSVLVKRTRKPSRRGSISRHQIQSQLRKCVVLERESKREMAIPILKAAISDSHEFFNSLSHTTRLLSIPKKRRLIVSASASASASAPSEINPLRSEVSFCVGTHLIPHPNKVDRGGEDAFFVSSYNGGVVAVADGVSGWAEQNVDPSLFPKELMANASDLVGDEEVNYDPQILLKKAHTATSSKGSATVIVAMLEKNGVLKIASVGDCGLRVIRKGKLIFSTLPQEHYFDCPYQLSSEVITQTYLDATVTSVKLLEGDTIVMGSDGLFDNVFDHEIVSTITQYSDAAEAAKALADLASNHSMDSNFESPYSLEARTRGFDVPFWKKVLGVKLTGGKPDDITVVVGQVVSS